MPARWTHVTFSVSDVDRSIDFYKSFCDLVVLRDRRREGGGTVWLGPQSQSGKNPTFIMVISKGDVSYQLDHLGFQCEARDQVDQIAERARKLGILELPPQDYGGVVGYFTMVRDPDGHMVEFTYGQPLEGLH
jgi:catechol 2,3-dioxygenase-like lactoylglutathione lyase family enzyme